MEGGPPMFRQDFTCPALLEDLKEDNQKRLERRAKVGDSPVWVALLYGP